MCTRVLQHALHGHRRPVERCEQPDRPVATRARGRGRTGRSEGFCRRLDPRVGPLHRKTACPGGTQGGPNCLTHSPPRCFPTPNLREADGNGYSVMAGRRREGSLGPPPVVASVNLVPLLWTGVPTPSTPVDRQDPLPIFRCPGNASCCARVLSDHLPDHLTYLLITRRAPLYFPRA